MTPCVTWNTQGKDQNGFLYPVCEEVEAEGSVMMICVHHGRKLLALLAKNLYWQEIERYCCWAGSTASTFITAFRPNNLPPLFNAKLLNSDDDIALQICELVSVSSNFWAAFEKSCHWCHWAKPKCQQFLSNETLQSVVLIKPWLGWYQGNRHRKGCQGIMVPGWARLSCSCLPNKVKCNNNSRK